MTIFDNWKDCPGDLTFETLITILTIENLNSVNHSFLTINCDTGQHSQFLRCLKKQDCKSDDQASSMGGRQVPRPTSCGSRSGNLTRWEAPSPTGAPVEFAPPHILPPVCVQYTSKLVRFRLFREAYYGQWQPLELTNKTLMATPIGKSGNERSRIMVVAAPLMFIFQSTFHPDCITQSILKKCNRKIF